MTAVKVCGLTRPEDAALARALGAAFLGFNFSAASPRRIDPAAARALLDAAAGAVRVGVFVDEAPAEVQAAIEALRLDLLQFHRELREDDFRFGLPVVAVCRVASGPPALPAPGLRRRCRAILFDTAHPGKVGGTGAVFDWDRVAGIADGIPIGVAGGLTPDNVGAAIAAVRPAFVDVASGVESAPGIKDAKTLEAFFAAVAHAG